MDTGLSLMPLAEMEKRLTARQEELEKQVHAEAGEPFNLNSPKQLGPILFEKLRIQEEAGVKRVRRTKTGYSTNAATLEAACRDPLIQFITEWKVRDLFMALRVAMTGKTETPPLFESMEVLGKARCIGRLSDALRVLGAPGKKGLKRLEKQKAAKIKEFRAQETQA